MTLRKHLVAAAMAFATVGLAVPATQAQSLTVIGSSSLSGGSYTYSYVVTPVSGTGSSFNINLLIFNFADTNFTGTPTATGPLTYNAPNSVPSGGVFAFDSGTLNAGTSETFTFVSPDAPGGTVGETAIAYNGSGVAAVNGTMPAPTAAPEPGSLASMAVLGTCLGLGIVARRRKMLAN